MKNLTKEQLKDYIPGKGCMCCAWNENECCEEDVDWTPKEVYELRLQVKELKSQVKKLKNAINETLTEHADLADGDVCTLKKLKDVML